MGFLDIFKKGGSRSGTQKLPWTMLEDVAQLEELESSSTQKIVVLFKHSTRCMVSRMAWSMFQKDFDPEWTGKTSLYIVDVLNARAVSQQIEKRFGVRHESPQLILLKDKKVVFHQSHAQITARRIADFL